MAQYVFTAASLPPLRIGEPPEISFEELEILLSENLLPKDYAQVKILRGFYDLLNIRALWKGEPLDRHGNLNENDLEEALLEHAHLPSFVLRFLDEYKTKEERIRYFPLLISEFFKEEAKNADPFLKEYLEFERRLQLVLLGFRAKKLGRSLEKELQFEDPDEDLIAQILAQKDAPHFEPPEGFEDLKAIFHAYQDMPIKLYQALSEYRFEKIEEMRGTSPFSISKILGYVVELIMAQKWMELDEKKGLEMVDKILEKSTGE
ncbi:MAG TPA: DUF2764 family protein [Parachlamydiaceae bacterium]|nr:DUF2764 family protein [Parachlamydiaceae bacterium]